MLYNADEEILCMNGIREHAELSEGIDKNRFIGDRSEYENQDD